MIFADTKNLEGHVSQIGLAAVSKLSSIRCLSKMGLPLEGIVALKKMVDEIECTLWSLIPLAVEHKKHGKDFQDQCVSLQNAINQFLGAAQNTKEFCKDM